MLKLSSLKPYKGSTSRRKVVGRGVGSGHGTYSGRGAKGQKARSGGTIPAGFEGGRMPLQRQIPKRRGFTSRNLKFTVVNLNDVNSEFKAGEEVNPKTLSNKGLIDNSAMKVKILGAGEISKSLIFQNISLTSSAKEKIAKVGGKIVETKPQATKAQA
jgi:large subunit ribosomal protein L15